MNDEAALPGRPASINLTAPERSNSRRRAPALHLAVALEGLPVVRLVADSFEDERRLVRWLATPGARRRLLDALFDGLDALAA